MSLLLVCLLISCKDDDVVGLSPYTCHPNYFINTQWSAAHVETITDSDGEKTTKMSDFEYNFRADNEILIITDRGETIAFWALQCSPDRMQLSTPITGIDPTAPPIFYSTTLYDVAEDGGRLVLTYSYFTRGDLHDIVLTLDR